MECNGTTYVGHVDDGLGMIRHVFCDAYRTIAVDARDGRRRSGRPETVTTAGEIYIYVI